MDAVFFELSFVTKQNSKGKRGRPVSGFGAFLRESGISRLHAWQLMRLAAIPEEQFERILAEQQTKGIIITRSGVLRAAGKLSPDRPRPTERGREQAIEHLKAAMNLIDGLCRMLREAGTEQERALANATFERTLRALRALYASV